MGGLDFLNSLTPSSAAAALFRCCGCARWASALSAARPFASSSALHVAAEAEWAEASRADILEAFSHHPRIGDRDSLRARFPATHQWSAVEQAAAAAADERALDDLAQGNRDYEARFGHIFIVCASGKTASEIQLLLQARLRNEPDVEIKIGAGEQMKITRLRLDTLLRESVAVDTSA